MAGAMGEGLSGKTADWSPIEDRSYLLREVVYRWSDIGLLVSCPSHFFPLTSA